MRTITDSARVTPRIKPVEGTNWAIERFQVSEGLAGLSGSFGSYVRTGRGMTPPGEYTKLVRKETSPRGINNEMVTSRSIVMSDTRDELRDIIEPLRMGRGRVLINGLGLGCVVTGLLAKPEVEHIDVVEICPELIELVGPYYEGNRCTIYEGDAFTYQWPRGTRWDIAWHDVWDTLCTDNLSDEEHAVPGTYAKLHRRYGARAAWQGSWGYELLKAGRRRGVPW